MTSDEYDAIVTEARNDYTEAVDAALAKMKKINLAAFAEYAKTFPPGHLAVNLTVEDGYSAQALALLKRHQK
jgi:hypothetical protein